LRHYASSRKVAGSSIDEVIGLFNLPKPPYGPSVDSASNRIEYQKIFVRGKARTACKAEKLTDVCQSLGRYSSLTDSGHGVYF
jgi:hypothetical protein